MYQEKRETRRKETRKEERREGCKAPTHLHEYFSAVFIVAGIEEFLDEFSVCG